MATEENRELKNVKSMLRSVLMSSKEGVPANQLQRDFMDMVGEVIPFKKFGYSTFENFIVSIPDVVIIERRGGEVILKARADEATSHVHKLILKQRGKKLKKPTRRPRGGGAGQYLSRGRGRAPPRGRPYAYPTTPIHRHGIPSFLPQTPIAPRILTPLRIKLDNPSVGTRTVAVNRALHNAMLQANRDATLSKPGAGNLNLPPRFRKQFNQSGQGRGPNTPFRRSPPKGPDFAKIDNPQGYVDALKKYLQDTCQEVKHSTLKSGNGYVCSIVINKRTFGSEDIFQTALEAEGAAAKRALVDLDVKSPTDWTGEIDWNAPSLGNKQVLSWAQEVSNEDSTSSLSPEQIQVIKRRVKEILKTKKNGLWANVIPHLYKENYKEEPPKDLVAMVKSWTDIAFVEVVPNTDRDIVYPVLVDENMSLTIPRASLINADTTQVVLYTTFVDHPGCFYCQREDSIIDTISQALQDHCKVAGAVDARSVKKGQSCAGLFSGDGMWTRAEILQVKDNGILELLFVDYGNIDDVKFENIRWLSPATAQFPPQAINCCLFGIEPLQGESAWSAKALELFEQLVGEEALVGIPKTIYEDGCVVELELFLKSDMSTSINNRLVQAGVACSTVQETVANDDDLHPDDLVLPEDNEWDAHITFITPSTDSVMLRLVGENYSDKLDAFQSVLQEAFRNSSTETPLQENMTYVALDDNLYHRVRVISKGDKMVSCYFLDHGDTDDCLPEQLHVLDPKINKMLPYQAVEVRLFGLEDVCTNMTALDSLAELAVGKPCVAEVIERDDIPSVVLYDTSGDTDININETILRTIESEGGGIDTPRTVSPSPKKSATATPTRVHSPVPNIDTKPDESKNSDSAITGVGTTKPIQQLTVNTEDMKVLNSDVQNLRLTNGKMDHRNNNVQRPNPSENLKRAITKNPAKMEDTGLRQCRIAEVGEYFDVHINFVNDPHNFVCIPYNQMERLNKLLLDMLGFYPNYNGPQLSKDEIQVGQVCAGEIDQIWFRVRVMRILGADMVSVYKVDIGEHAAIPVTSLKPLLPQYMALPMMALNARLGSIRSSSSNWLEAAKYKFIELARGHDLVALVRGIDTASGVADLRLIDTSSEEYDICIDEVLVRLGYATLV